MPLFRLAVVVASSCMSSLEAGNPLVNANLVLRVILFQTVSCHHVQEPLNWPERIRPVLGINILLWHRTTIYPTPAHKNLIESMFMHQRPYPWVPVLGIFPPGKASMRVLHNPHMQHDGQKFLEFIRIDRLPPISRCYVTSKWISSADKCLYYNWSDK